LFLIRRNGTLRRAFAQFIITLRGAGDGVPNPVRAPVTIPQLKPQDIGVLASILALLAIVMKSADAILSRTVCPILILPNTVDPYMGGQPNNNTY